MTQGAADAVVAGAGSRAVRYVLCGLSSRAIGRYLPSFTNGTHADVAELVGVLDIDRERAETVLRMSVHDVSIYLPDQFDQKIATTRPDIAELWDA
jgi:predicted dehydrogenase